MGIDSYANMGLPFLSTGLQESSLAEGLQII